MQTSGLNEQWDVIEVTGNDLIGTVGCLITGIMDLLQGQAKRDRRGLREVRRAQELLLGTASAVLDVECCTKHACPQMVTTGGNGPLGIGWHKPSTNHNRSINVSAGMSPCFVKNF